MNFTRVEISHGDVCNNDATIPWSLSEKLQGLAGVSAPILGGFFGIQIYEYLTIMIYGSGNLSAGWPLILTCLFYVCAITISGFYLLLRLERKFGHKQTVEVDQSQVPMVVLGVGMMVGIAMMVHRAAFITIPV